MGQEHKWWRVHVGEMIVLEMIISVGCIFHPSPLRGVWRRSCLFLSPGQDLRAAECTNTEDAAVHTEISSCCSQLREQSGLSCR
jgi:hypothetical protein